MSRNRFGLSDMTRAYTATIELSKLVGEHLACRMVGRKAYVATSPDAYREVATPGETLEPLVEIEFDRAERLAWYLAVGMKNDPETGHSQLVLETSDLWVKQYNR